MESLAKSDIFFFITTVCVVAVTVLVVMILFNVLRIVRKARKTIDRIQNEADGFIADVSELRDTLRKNQFGLKPIFDEIKKRVKKPPRRKKETVAEET